MAKNEVKIKGLTKLFNVDRDWYKKKLKSALRKSGNWSPEMEGAVELAAGAWFAYDKVLEDVEAATFSYCKEITREGNTRLSPHPAFKMFAIASETFRRSLRELRLTISSIDGLSDEYDGITDLISKVNSVGKRNDKDDDPRPETRTS